MLNLRSYLRRLDGSLTVEAALTVPLLMSLGMTGIDMSYLLLQHHQMQNQLSVAGNYLAKSRDTVSYEAQARRLATTGQVATGGTRLIENWDASDVSITYKTVVNANGAYRGAATIPVIQLTSDIPYSGIGVISSVTRGNIRLKAAYEERVIGNGG